MRAAIYARYSSHNQRDVSIEDQVKFCTEFIESKGWELVAIYKDAAKTGTTNRRADFKRLLADAEKDVYDIVVPWHTDRINRNVVNAFYTLSRLFEYDKDFCSATQPELNEKGSLRLVLFTLYAWKDELVSLDIGKNVKRGQRSNAEKGHPNGQLRFGWDIAGAFIDGHGKHHPGDHYSINALEAEAVRVMFKMRASGHTWRGISSRLATLGYTNKYGRTITDNSVRKMVSNQAYKGVYRYADIVIDGGIPQIVTSREWEAAQHHAKRRLNNASIAKGTFASRQV
ncbi:MAG: recombinase family protein [Raoultibacter sp.]